MVWADEGPLEHLLLSVRVLDRVADVEDLAVVGHVRIVSVPLALACEFVHYVLPATERVRVENVRVVSVPLTLACELVHYVLPATERERGGIENQCCRSIAFRRRTVFTDPQLFLPDPEIKVPDPAKH